VKVQHADIEEISQLDLEILGRVLAIVRLVGGCEGSSVSRRHRAAHSRGAFDFERRSTEHRDDSRQLRVSPDVHFPTVLPELSTQRVLTTS